MLLHRAIWGSFYQALIKIARNIHFHMMFSFICSMLAIMHIRMQKEVLEALAFNMTLKAKVEDILQNLQESVATTEKG